MLNTPSFPLSTHTSCLWDLVKYFNNEKGHISKQKQSEKQNETESIFSIPQYYIT